LYLIDCLVQGPLTCTLLLELLETQLRTSPRPLSLMSFSYRAVSPLYVNRPMKLCGRWLPNNETSEQESDEIRCELWALDDRGSLAMTGTATLEPIDAGTPGI
jgi:3-methylfumaryl-CoA hydratase